MKTTSQPIYCKDYDEEGITWNYRVILSDYKAFEYTYFIEITNEQGAVYQLVTNETIDPALIAKWRFELDAGIYQACTKDECLQQLKQAQSNIDDLLKKAVDYRGDYDTTGGLEY